MCVNVCVLLGLGLDLTQQSPFEVEIRKLSPSVLPSRAIPWLNGRKGIYKLFSHFHTVSLSQMVSQTVYL